MNKINVFCFPYAGGAAASFNSWRPFLNGKPIALKPVELAGRGRRMREPNHDSIHEAVDDVFGAIKDQLTEPYAFFGHSMGSQIAFELAHKIKTRGLPEPIHIFFSGRAAPQVPRDNKRTFHHLPVDEFKKEVLELGGTPKEFFEYPELMEVFLPLLQSDFRNAETYVYDKKNAPLSMNITVLSGKLDEDTPEEVEVWNEQTTGRCEVHYFEGDHFFLNEEPERVMSIIGAALDREARR